VKKYLSLILTSCGLIVSSICLVLLLNLTNPSSAGSFGVLLIFANIYLVTFLVWMVFLSFSRIVYDAVRIQNKTVLSEEKRVLHRKKLIYVVSVINFSPIFFISMNSIGQLNFLSVILFFAVEAVVIFYVLRRF
jgi:hypothetical protein